MTVNDKQQTQLDKEITLHYIDKVHNSLTETVQSLNRVGISLLLLCLSTITLCLGLVSTNSSFSFGGLNFVISPWVVIIGGAWTVGILFMYMLALENHRSLLTGEIINLYKSIGYEKESMKFEGTGALEVPNLTSMLGESVSFTSFSFGKIVNLSMGIATFIAFFLTPIIAEACACYRIIDLFGWSWWVIVSFLLLFLLILSHLIAFFGSIITEANLQHGK